jgi:hypothetical protein
MKEGADLIHGTSLNEGPDGRSRKGEEEALMEAWKAGML